MSRSGLWKWTPAAFLMFGAAFTLGVDQQKAVPLRADLETTITNRFGEFVGADVVISEEEQRAAGMTDYLMRTFTPEGAPEDAPYAFSIYVGYYDQQIRGKTIHSPKNCLPGSGWEALQSRLVTVPTATGPVEVNRYLLQREDSRALVLYWYQGRGRIEANEYIVKANLLRDAALRGRSEEALVRIVVPVTTTEEDALELATGVAEGLVSGVAAALPT